MEFLTEVTLTVPAETPQERVDQLCRAETVRAAELAAEGHILRLWRPTTPGWRNIGLWQAADEDELRKKLATLPLHPWMTVTIRQLTPHPNDPQ